MIAVVIELALIALVFVVFLYVGLPWLYGRYQKRRLGAKAAQTHTLVLTFDDGPGSQLTPAVLQVLKKYDVKATFFVLGRNIKGNEQLLKQAFDDGHEIATHGYDHFNYWWTSPLRCFLPMPKLFIWEAKAALKFGVKW